ncbi:MAG: hypothetical protein LWX07_10835 [Bacteroidetes bacterium]|nr:hypothetical protein [Bacteroidota bacterium]
MGTSISISRHEVPNNRDAKNALGFVTRERTYESRLGACRDDKQGLIETKT